MSPSLSERFPGQMLPVKAIRLSQGQVAIIDPEDWLPVSGYTWHAYKNHCTWYAATTILHPDGGYTRDGRKRQTSLHLHTLITGYSMTDHVNGNGLDNRRVNLRLATTAQNLANKRRYANNSSGHTGVRFHKGGYEVRVGSGNSRDSYIGVFSSYYDAVAAYHKATTERYGVFAPRCCDARKGVA